MASAGVSAARRLFQRLGTRRLVEHMEENVFLGRSSKYVMWRHGAVHAREYRKVLALLIKETSHQAIKQMGAELLKRIG